MLQQVARARSSAFPELTPLAIREMRPPMAMRHTAVVPIRIPQTRLQQQPSSAPAGGATPGGAFAILHPMQPSHMMKMVCRTMMRKPSIAKSTKMPNFAITSSSHSSLMSESDIFSLLGSIWLLMLMAIINTIITLAYVIMPAPFGKQQQQLRRGHEKLVRGF